MEASIGINIRGPSRTAYVSKKDEDDKKKAGQRYTVLCESFGSAVSTLKDGCGRQSEKKSKKKQKEEEEEEEEEEDEEEWLSEWHWAALGICCHEDPRGSQDV